MSIQCNVPKKISEILIENQSDWSCKYSVEVFCARSKCSHRQSWPNDFQMGSPNIRSIRPLCEAPRLNLRIRGCDQISRRIWLKIPKGRDLLNWSTTSKKETSILFLNYTKIMDFWIYTIVICSQKILWNGNYSPKTVILFLKFVDFEFCEEKISIS